MAEEFKIRVLPRKGENTAEGASKNEKASPKREGTASSAKAKPPRWIIYVGLASLLLLAGVVLAPSQNKLTTAAKPNKVVEHRELSSVNTRIGHKITKHMEDSLARQELLMRQREIENHEATSSTMAPEDGVIFEDEPNRVYGLHFDQENSAEQVFKDLDINSQKAQDFLPDDRINARLATRKWTNEFERRERIVFIRNFIKSAYDRGYEVQLDQNLVVVGVRRINKTEKVNIDQVLDRLAKQGY